MENYLYFRTQATLADDDDIAQSAMFPVSSFLGCYPLGDTTLKLHFKPVKVQQVFTTRVLQQDTDLTSASIMVKQPYDLLTDSVVLTITANTHKTVMEALVIEMRKEANSTGFIVVADDISSGTTYLHTDITACGVITIQVAGAGEDSYSSTFA